MLISKKIIIDTKEIKHNLGEFEGFFARNRIYEDTALNFIKAFQHAYIVREKRIE